MKKVKDKIILQYDNTINFFSETLTQASSKKGFMRYFKNTGWLFIGKILGMIASFFVGAYVARYLGPSQYGLLVYASSFVGLFSIFSSLGINSVLSRELISHPEQKEELLGSSFLIKMIGSIISIILIVVSLFFIKADWLTNTLIIISALSFIFNAFGIIDIYFQTQVLAKNVVRVQIVSLIITSILKLLFIYFGFGLISFAIVSLISGIITAIGLIFIYKKMSFQLLKWRWNKSLIKMLIQSSWPLLLSGIASTIYLKIDQVMIKNMISNEASGLYAISAKLSTIWYFIPEIICTSLFPAIINAKRTSNYIYKKRLINLFLLLTMISTSIVIFVFLFSSPIINIIFGNAYAGAYNILRVYIWSTIPIFLIIPIANYLIIENQIKINLWATLGGAIFNILLNLVLIPKYNVIGAAIATLISYTSVIFIMIFLIKIKNRIIKNPL